MNERTHPDEPLVALLIAQLRQMREAERDLFGALDSTVRDAPMRPGDWSPKDHQAHLTAWKARQADRIEAMRGGHAYPTDDRETDEINAELQATRADWPWGRIVAEADEVSSRLEAEIRAAGSALLLESGRLVGGIFGNGPFHAATHFGWLADARIGLDEARLAAFIETEEELLNATALPDSDRGTGLYNLACVHALAGRLDRARSLLHDAFRLRPDLVEYALGDADLAALAEELPALAR
jgi:hypothetical protein